MSLYNLSPYEEMYGDNDKDITVTNFWDDYEYEEEEYPTADREKL